MSGFSLWLAPLTPTLSPRRENCGHYSVPAGGGRGGLRRSGITLIEVLVLLLFLVVGLGLLVVLIGKQREEAAKVHCANNLRRIGEGIIRCAEGKKGLGGGGFYPAARIADGFATWGVQITPYLFDKDPLAGWDLTKKYTGQTDAVRQTVVPLFFCPARNRSAYLSGAGEAAGALGDYACASGDGDPAFPWTGPTANGALILGEVLEEKDGAILRWQSRTGPASLKRLLASTLLVGEKHVPMAELGQTKAGDGSLYNGAFPASFARVGGPGYGLAPGPAAPFNTNFGSSHAGVCQFLHADGSVRAYINSINEEVLGGMIRRE